jgi:hypothetical protein
VIISFLLIGFWALNYGVIGEDRTAPLYTVVGQNCLCTDTGVCKCKSGECGCEDCDSKKQPETLIAPPAIKRTRLIREFVGYETRRECTGSGCRYVRVPVYRTVEVDE